MSARSEQLDADRRDHYRQHRNRVGEQLLRAAMRSAATVEAASMVNQRLAIMGLRDLSLDVEEVHANAETVLRAEVASILARHAHLAPSQKREFAARVMARMVPYRDGGGTPIAPNRKALSRQRNLEQDLEREIAKMSAPQREQR